MLLVDANLLLYAVNTSSAQHLASRGWLDAKLSSTEPIGLAWLSLIAFLRISTHGNIFPKPLLPGPARTKMDAWLAQPNVRILHPTEDHWEIFSELIVKYRCSGNLITDAHLAALAIEHGATLCSTDLDFSRFARLKWINPLTEPRARTDSGD